MRLILWGLLWLSAAGGLTGCYGNMEPGSTTSTDNSLPIDTTLYQPEKVLPLAYHRQQYLLNKPLPPRLTDTSAAASRWKLNLGTYRRPAPYRPDTSARAAIRRLRMATNSELQAMSPVSKPAPPPTPAPVVAGDEAAPASAPSPAVLLPMAVEMRVQRDGDVKLKDAAGNKLKVDADDGTVKEKPVGGGKIRIK